MNKKMFFVMVAGTSLLVQIAFPMWGATVIKSFWIFFIEGILEGGLLGNSFFYGLFSIYSVIALIVPIWSFFSVKGIDSERIYLKKKNIVFLIVNILTVILAITLVILNKGFLPRM